MKPSILPLLLTLALPLHAEEKVLNIYNWNEYVGKQALKDFEAETGIKVHYDIFDNVDMLESKVLTGRSGYDVIFPTIAMVGRFIPAKALQPIDPQRLGGFANLDPQVLGEMAAADPGNRYAVPYTWGTTGLAMNRQEVEKRIPDAPLDSLDLLFKPEYASRLKDCGIAIVDAPQEVISIALHYLGRPPYSQDSADLEAAGDLLAALKPNLRYIGFGTQTSDLANGNLCLALTFNGDASMARFQAEEAGKPYEIVYRIPREGTLMWVDTMAVPADAPHPEAARAFIEFMLRPESMAELSNGMFFANANQAATPLLDEAVSGDPNIYPPQEVRAKLFGEELIAPKLLRERTRLWARFRGM
ncbi:Spermidine-binding periplasmic protein SpuE [Pseudomonas carbonaria]|uniref:Putrescine-binding periplasmic protein n=1 Tax=Zestomonas carbonaria TaxID=2762745 RepID=A0A7U7I8P9_9GAMM|nr:Spermidine-binding periplasmic protein SpuE [Pseudomonas carbonaria]